MKQILSLLVVICLIFSLPVISFAQDDQNKLTVGASATLDGYTVHDTINWERSINQDANVSTLCKLVTGKKPKEIKYGDFQDGTPGFPNGFLQEVGIRSSVEENGIYTSEVRIYYPKYTQDDYNKYKDGITGAIIVYFEDGEEIDFKVKITLTNSAEFIAYAVDENQKPVDIWDLPQGGIYTIKLEVADPGRELENSTINVKWKIYNGNNRVRLIGSNGVPEDEAPDKSVWDDQSTVTGNGLYDAPLPFGFTFYAKEPGKFDFRYYVYKDNESNPFTSMGHGAEIKGSLDIIGEETLDEVFADPSAAEYTIKLADGDKGLDENSFETIWEKADGKLVNIEVEGGVTMTFDTSNNIDGFLNDLKQNRNGVFNPSVNPAMPSDASGSGFSGGRWIEFMHSGKLPGNVTIKMPIAGFTSGTSLKLWYFDSVTGRATEEPSTVTIETVNGVEYAVFTITHCSAYAIYPQGVNPNPVQNNGESNNLSSGKSSHSNSDDQEYYTNWSSIREEIRNAKSGDTIVLMLSKGDPLPSSVLRALAEMDNVTLKVRYNGETLYILSADVANIEAKSYSFKELLNLFGDSKNQAKQERSNKEDIAVNGVKLNPGTGAYPMFF